MKGKSGTRKQSKKASTKLVLDAHALTLTDPWCWKWSRRTGGDSIRRQLTGELGWYWKSREISARKSLSLQQQWSHTPNTITNNRSQRTNNGGDIVDNTNVNENDNENNEAKSKMEMVQARNTKSPAASAKTGQSTYERKHLAEAEGTATRRNRIALMMVA